RQVRSKPLRQLVGRTAGDLIVSIPIGEDGSNSLSEAAPGTILPVQIVSAAALILQGRAVKTAAATSQAPLPA
ncbi:MAG: hypothetical protein ACK5WX_02205, partial [bacterium]